MSNLRKQRVERLDDIFNVSEITNYSDEMFVKEFIPSNVMRECIIVNKHKFADYEKAAIIWNSRKSLQRQHALFQCLALNTDDLNLKVQLNERILFDRESFSLFFLKQSGYVYAVNSLKYSNEDNIIGYYKTAEMAYQEGLKTGIEFELRKYQIIEEGIEIIKPRSISSPLIQPDESKQLEEHDYHGSPVANIAFYPDGNIKTYYSFEHSKQEELHVNILNRTRFENAFVRFPNPFKSGEKVKILPTGRVGIVETTPEIWEALQKRASEENAVEDWSDSSLIIKFENSLWNHVHVIPIYVERINNDE